MLQAVVRVAATADDCALRVHNNGAYAWIGRGQSDISPGQVKGSAEEEFVRIARCSHSRSIISSRRQGRTERQTIRLIRAFAAETIRTSLPQVRRPLRHCDPWDHVGLEPACPRKDLSVVVACGGYGATNPAKSAMLPAGFSNRS